MKPSYEPFLFISVFSFVLMSLFQQEAQLSQRGRAMPRVVEYFG